MNYIEESKTLLESVPSMEQAVKNLRTRLDRASLKGKPGEVGSIDFSKGFSDTKALNDTLEDMLEVNRLSKELTATKWKLQDIYDVLDQLEDEEKLILELWYVKGLPKEEIAEELHYSPSSLKGIYSLRNQALFNFAILYFGASAI